MIGYTCNDDDHEHDGDDNPLDDDDGDHRLTSVIIGSNSRPWKIFTRALVAAFAGRAVGLSCMLYVEYVTFMNILRLRKIIVFNLLVQVSWQGPWPLFNKHSFTSRQSPWSENFNHELMRWMMTTDDVLKQ